MFRAQSAHPQDVNDANCTYAASGIVTLCKCTRNLCIKLVIIKKMIVCLLLSVLVYKTDDGQ